MDITKLEYLIHLLEKKRTVLIHKRQKLEEHPRTKNNNIYEIQRLIKETSLIGSIITDLRGKRKKNRE